jgi:hypothetical protein
MIVERSTGEDALTRIETRLRRVERYNRVLATLLFTTVAIASIGAAIAAPNILTVDEIRAHRISLLDPTGAVVAGWHSDAPGTWNERP